MPLTVNLRHFAEGNLELDGDLSPEDLGLADLHDELVAVKEPLRYDLDIEKHEHHLLVQGRLDLTLNVTCKRCLKEFTHELNIDPYHAYVPLEGEDAAPVQNDLVDLSPFIREDVLLAFPQHPLCSEDCAGMANVSGSKTTGSDKSPPGNKSASAWSALDKLKLK